MAAGAGSAVSSWYRGADQPAAIAAQRPSLRTLFTSGYTADVLQDALSGGHDLNLLAKPCAVDELARHAREVLDTSPLKI